MNYPYFVAEDTTTQHAYVPAANYHSQTVFIDYDIRGRTRVQQLRCSAVQRSGGRHGHRLRIAHDVYDDGLNL